MSPPTEPGRSFDGLDGRFESAPMTAFKAIAVATPALSQALTVSSTFLWPGVEPFLAAAASSSSACLFSVVYRQEACRHRDVVIDRGEGNVGNHKRR